MRRILRTTSLLISAMTIDMLTHQAHSGTVTIEDDGPSIPLRKFAQHREFYKELMVDSEFQKPSVETVQNHIATFYTQLKEKIQKSDSPLDSQPEETLTQKLSTSAPSLLLKRSSIRIMRDRLEERMDPRKKRISVFLNTDDTNFLDTEDSELTDTTTDLEVSDDEYYGDPDFMITRNGDRVFDERLLKYNLEPTHERLKAEIARMEKKITKIDAEIAKLEEQIAQAEKEYSMPSEAETISKISLSIETVKQELNSPSTSQNIILRETFEKDNDGPTMVKTKELSSFTEQSTKASSSWATFFKEALLFWKSR